MQIDLAAVSDRKLPVFEEWENGRIKKKKKVFDQLKTDYLNFPGEPERTGAMETDQKINNLVLGVWDPFFLKLSVCKLSLKKTSQVPTAYAIFGDVEHKIILFLLGRALLEYVHNTLSEYFISAISLFFFENEIIQTLEYARCSLTPYNNYILPSNGLSVQRRPKLHALEIPSGLLIKCTIRRRRRWVLIREKSNSTKTTTSVRAVTNIINQLVPRCRCVFLAPTNTIYRWKLCSRSVDTWLTNFWFCSLTCEIPFAWAFMHTPTPSYTLVSSSYCHAAVETTHTLCRWFLIN